MQSHPRVAWPGQAALLLMLFLAGCSSGEKSVAVRGRLLQIGQPLKVPTEKLPPGDKGIRLVFYALSPEGAVQNSYTAAVRLDDATFQVLNPKHKGIPPGKYRISVILGSFGGQDQFQGEFGQTNSPLTIDIPEGGSVDLDVDVGTKTVTVK